MYASTRKYHCSEKLPSYENKLEKSSDFRRYIVTLVPRVNRFHCCNRDPSSSLLLFGRFKSLKRSFNSYWVIRCGRLVFGSSSNSLLQELCEDSAEVSGSVTGDCATGRIKLGYSIFFLVL